METETTPAEPHVPLNPDGTPNYLAVSVPDLRTLCRRRKIGPALLIAGANKATCIAALETGIWPGEAVKHEAPATAPVPAPADTASAVQALQAVLATLMPKTGLDEPRVREIAAEEAAKLPSAKLEVKIADLPSVEMDRQHARYGLLLLAVANDVPVMLVGPAGSGKTSAAVSVARNMGVKFGCLSVNPQTSKSDLFGYKDAGGTYHPSMFADCYGSGGVMLMDEIDAGNPGVLTGMNAAAAGNVMPTQNGIVNRHEQFRLIAAANTFGQGADRQYVGRNQLDAATLDRFFVLEWGIDAGLEAACVGLSRHSEEVDIGRGGLVSTGQWFERVAKVREAIAAEKVRAVVSPRATILGDKLARAGMGRFWLEEGLLWKGMDADARKRVEARCK
jgi:cobaltochelatase CobS